tara:strand:+ start:2246 stop:2608 length:363 start_codon:yes stop_codon:yes gene_type:complete
MAAVTTQTSPYVDKLITDDDANETVEANVLTGAATCYIFDGNNGNNTATTYLKVWNHTGPTNNSTEFDILIMLPGLTRQTVTVGGGIALPSGLSFIATQGAALANISGPLNPVTVKIMAE